MIKKIAHYFDKLEDKIRGFLSRFPVLYALIGGIGIVLFWRGIWGLSEDIGLTNLEVIFISLILLFSTGLFVSFFIGDRFIISSLKGEKKMIEKTKDEIIAEESEIRQIFRKLKILEQKIDELVRQK